MNGRINFRIAIRVPEIFYVLRNHESKEPDRFIEEAELIKHHQSGEKDTVSDDVQLGRDQINNIRKKGVLSVYLKINEIQHKAVKYLLTHLKIKNGLEIHYDGSDAYLESASTTLHFRVASGNRLSIDGTSGDVSMQGASGKNVSWDNSAASLIFNDNAKAIFGSSSAGLEIFHNRNNSLLKDSGTGELFVQTNSLKIENAVGDEAMISALQEGAVELFHGYTYSAIPVAVAAALAVQDIFEKEDIFNRAKNLAPYFQKGLFSLQDLESVENIRGYGMMGGIDMKMHKKPGAAGFTCFKHCYEAGVNFKATGDCLIIAPMFISEKKHIDEMIEKLRTGITNYFKEQ